jgi:hypothetical protein
VPSSSTRLDRLEPNPGSNPDPGRPSPAECSERNTPVGAIVTCRGVGSRRSEPEIGRSVGATARVDPGPR